MKSSILMFAIGLALSAGAALADTTTNTIVGGALGGAAGAAIGHSVGGRDGAIIGGALGGGAGAAIGNGYGKSDRREAASDRRAYRCKHRHRRRHCR
ncbi:hypothetical protein BI347_06100 [Chromobacterium sphagni]|uniref:Glycine zipper domain-containing protein n=1 Tax=Chromobacterium sphagni TaxID=1903179 RepID=A0A1S1X121_9NEIS|nr:glycine zipper domain-containing protein [Chromobacterium sphagni]OHX13119.1 hypothetical protein BI347_06100 [Chromobacterium sphagni]